MLLRCFICLPRKIQYLFGYALGILWWDIIRLRRDIVLENLEIAFPNMTTSEKSALARRSIINMGKSFVEHTWMPFYTSENYINDFVFKGIEYLEQARAKGKGVCLLALHLGNGDMALAGMSLKGLPIMLISKKFKLRWLNDIWFEMRGRLGTEFISPRNSSYAILKGLKKQKIVIFVHDQFMGPPTGAKTLFFGKETGTALGLAVMSYRSKAPVVPVFTFRREDGKTQVEYLPEVPFEEYNDRDHSLVYMTQKYNSIIEDLIRQHPDQWMWVHRRWKKFIQKGKTSIL